MAVPSATHAVPLGRSVESRLESVLWQEDGRVHWSRRHIVISLIRDCQLTVKNDKCSIRLRNCAAFASLSTIVVDPLQ